MNTTLLTIITLASPVMFSVIALIPGWRSGRCITLIKRLSVTVAAITILIAAILIFATIKVGLTESTLFIINGIGLSLRLDALSVTMFTVIALISFIVIKFSLNYLEGDARQGVFIGRLAATIIAVQFLVLSGNLGGLLISWILTSVFLHMLLLFYPDRRGAVIAARKKFLIARLGDACLTAAIMVLYKQFGTGNLEIIFDHIKQHTVTGVLPKGVEAAALLLALAAILKSAQFPAHGWLIEVMETPTPVSALLHAGLLNAGPFLIIRMSFLIHASLSAPLLLITIGGFTALFASTVYLTQTSVKTALSYSSVAHMGFSLLICGLGVFPAAMLHLVAHSFYKAHAFLSSGSVIEVLRASKFTSAQRIGSPFKIFSGIIMGIGFYAASAAIWGVNPLKDFSLFAVGAIMVMGLSRIFTSAIDAKGSRGLILKACFLALLVSMAFFSLETLLNPVLHAQVPQAGISTFDANVLISILLIAFAIVVLIQIVAPVVSTRKYYRTAALHIRNGLYVNAVFDRMTGSLKISSERGKFNKHAANLQSNHIKYTCNEYYNRRS